MISLPKDFRAWPEFRALQAEMQKSYEPWAAPFVATSVLINLYVQLAYAAEHVGVGNVGVISRSELDMTPLLQEIHVLKSLTSGEFPLLVERDGRYFCARFAADNKHLDAGYEPSHVRAHKTSQFLRGINKAARTVGDAVLALNPAWLVNHNGQPLSDEMVRRIWLLVVSLDNALLRQHERKEHEFGEGVIRSALSVIEKYSAQEIESKVRKVFENRNHPGQPKTAEQIIEQWDAAREAKS